MLKEDFSVELEELREDIPQPCDKGGFWDNVPNSDDGYIITEKVRGV